MAGAKSGEYRLDALLELRQREEDDKKTALAEAIALTMAARQELAAAHAQEAAARHEHAQAVARAAEKMRAGPTSVREAVDAKHYAERLRLAIEAAQRRVEQVAARVRDAESAEEVARAQVGEAVKARQAIDKHKESWQAERKRELERKAETEADDHSRKR